MAKTFYTEHDIEDMVHRGVQSLVLNDDIVLTELAYEKANRLGLKLVHPVDTPPAAPIRPYIAAEGSKNMPPAKPSPGLNPSSKNEDVKSRIKNAVIARLGSQVDPILLDTIIERVLNKIEEK